MATKSKIGKRHEFESLSNQAFNEFYIRQNFRVWRFKFLHINIIRDLIPLKLNAIDISEARQAKTEKGYDA